LAIKRNNIKEIKYLEHLTQLKRLELAFNEITEIMGLAELENLEIIDLRGNPVYDNELKLATEKMKVKLLDAKELVFYCKRNKI